MYHSIVCFNKMLQQLIVIIKTKKKNNLTKILLFFIVATQGDFCEAPIKNKEQIKDLILIRLTKDSSKIPFLDLFIVRKLHLLFFPYFQ